MNSAHRKPLPGTRLDYFDAREAVEAIQPGAYAKLPYTSRVLAENLVRRCDPATLEASLRQLVERKRDLDFPWYPARVVCHDILGQTALVDLAGLRDAIADKGGDPAQVNPVVPVQLIVDHSLAVECGGYDPEAFVNYLALLGWSLDGETTIVPREVLAREFSLDHVSKNPATFDPAKLDWINAQYYEAMDDLEFARRVLEPALVTAGREGRGCVDARPEWFSTLAAILKPRTKRASDVEGLTAFLYAGDTPEIEEKAWNKALAKDGAAEALAAAKGALEGLADFDAGSIDAALEALPERLGTNKRKFFAAVRAAETGSLVSPPLGASVELLGRACALARLDAAIAKVAAGSREA